jgi:catechol 2,3-dioxygenase-like lactoylglutathione lyase family enzyme
MLGDKEGIATLGVKDIKRAAEFYEGKLGLKPTPEEAEPTTRSYRAGKSAIFVYDSQYAGTNEATAVTWDVGEDVEALVKELDSKGVPFEHYDFPDTKREGHLHLAGELKLAWFKDPDGNIHALMGR